MGRANLNAVRRAWLEGLVAHTPYIIVGLVLIILPSFMPHYLQGIMSKALIFGIFAMSLNLLMGYTGLFSLGHAAYFGMAGYTTGILIVRYGVESFWLAAPAGILMAALFAAIFGIVALRVSGVYFLAVTLALGQLLYSVAVKWRSMTGGTDGLIGMRYPDLGLPWLTMNATSFYYLVFAVFVVSLLLLYRFVNSPFGYALQGIRDNEPRMKSSGYNTWLHKYIAFVIGGLFAGVAGVLYAYYGGIVAPGHLGILTSTTIMLMVIIGSERAFLGPVVGAVTIVFLEYYSSIYTPDRWPLILGSVFVLSVMFLRGGITVYLSRLWKKVRYQYGSTKS